MSTSSGPGFARPTVVERGPAGARLVVLLHDAVIPAELQARTWQYLTGESGATTTARRDATGHAPAEPAAAALADWLTDLTKDAS